MVLPRREDGRRRTLPSKDEAGISGSNWSERKEEMEEIGCILLFH